MSERTRDPPRLQKALPLASLRTSFDRSPDQRECGISSIRCGGAHVINGGQIAQVDRQNKINDFPTEILAHEVPFQIVQALCHRRARTHCYARLPDRSAGGYLKALSRFELQGVTPALTITVPADLAHPLHGRLRGLRLSSLDARRGEREARWAR